MTNADEGKKKETTKQRKEHDDKQNNVKDEQEEKKKKHETNLIYGRKKKKRGPNRTQSGIREIPGAPLMSISSAIRFEGPLEASVSHRRI